MEKAWDVIYDDETLTMEVIGSSSDNTLLTKNVAAMQEAGMKVRCSSADIGQRKEEVTARGYNVVKNLYSRLLDDYYSKTRKQLKRW